MEGMEALVDLKILSIQVWLALGSLCGSIFRIMFQANRIRQIEGLERLTALEELYVADNGLTSMK